MSNVNTIVNITKKPSDSSGGNVILSQEPWPEHSDIVTKFDIAEAVIDSIYDSADLSIKCSLQNGIQFDTALYAFPYPEDLIFSVNVTRGQIFGALITYHTIMETVSFSLTTEESTRFPIHSVLSIQKVKDNALDEYGREVLNPIVKFDGEKLVTPKPIYYTVIVTYTSKRYRYPITIDADVSKVENYFESVAYAVWDGGVRFEVLDPPNGADNDYETGQSCFARSQLNVVGSGSSGGEDDDIPKAKAEDIYIDVAYCTQKVYE